LAEAGARQSRFEQQRRQEIRRQEIQSSPEFKQQQAEIERLRKETGISNVGQLLRTIQGREIIREKLKQKQAIQIQAERAKTISVKMDTSIKPIDTSKLPPPRPEAPQFGTRTDLVPRIEGDFYLGTEPYLERRVIGFDKDPKTGRKIPITEIVYREPQTFKGGGAEIIRPATKEEVEFYRSQPKELIAETGRVNIPFRKAKAKVVGVYETLQQDIREGITEPLIGQIDTKKARKDIERSTEFLISGKFPKPLAKTGRAISLFGINLLEEIEEKPLKYGLITGVSTGIGLGISGVTAGATAISPTLGLIARGGATVGGVALGGIYALDVTERLRGAKTTDEVTEILAETTLESTAFGVGSIIGGRFVGRRVTREPKFKPEEFVVKKPSTKIPKRKYDPLYDEIIDTRIAKAEKEEFLSLLSEARLKQYESKFPREIKLEPQVRKEIKTKLKKKIEKELYEPDISEIQKLSLKKFKEKQPKKTTLTSSLENINKQLQEQSKKFVEEAVARRKARLKSEADIIVYDAKLGDFKIVEAKPRFKKPKPKPIEASIDPEFIRTIVSQQRARLRTGEDIFIIGKTGELRIQKARPRFKKPKSPLKAEGVYESALKRFRENQEKSRKKIEKELGVEGKIIEGSSKQLLIQKLEQPKQKQLKKSIDIQSQDVMSKLIEPKLLKTVQVIETKKKVRRTLLLKSLEDSLQLQEPPQRIKLTQPQVSLLAPKVIPLLDFEVFSDIGVKQVPRLKTKQIQRLKTKVAQEQPQVFAPRQRLRFRQREELVERLIFRERFKEKLKKPKFKRKREEDPFEELETFGIFVKRKGKLVPVGKDLTRSEAVKRLERALTTDPLLAIARTGFIRPTGRKKKVFAVDDFGTPDPIIFRGYRIRKGKRVPLKEGYIQRTSANLQTQAEQKALQDARKLNQLIGIKM